MERRVLLAIFLCFLVIYVWQALFVRPQPKPGSTTPFNAAQPATSPAGVGSAPPPAALPPQPMTPALAPALVADNAARDIRVETSDVIAVFTNRGGRLKGWRLKHYADQRGEPLELIPSQLADTQPLPFSLRIEDDAATTTALNSTLYTVSAPPATLTESVPADLVFEYRDTAGLHAVKQFHLEPKSYVLTFHATITSGDHALVPTIQWGPALGDTETATRFAVKPGGLLSAGGKEQRLTASSVAKQPTYEDDFKYAGVEDHYFLSVALDLGRAKVSYQALSIPPPPDSKDLPRDLMAYAIEPSRADQALKFYIGPKDFNELASVDRELVRAINFGIWSFIVVPLLRSLKWINGYVGNYGWSIIALTVIINLIIFPLRHKSVVAMRKMQEIQPEVKAIQDRYAKLKISDPARQKMNQELMELYKQRGANPAAGCVPMLLPFPILLAFYSLLTTAIELRGAPFTLWIHDLAAPDPYYVTPILMGASQLWQQWIMPAAGVDPVQRRMAMIMPVVFMFLFVTSPSGIAIYWLASTLWGIGQQYFTNYWIGPPNIRTVRPAAERRAKRVGSGKPDAAVRED
jgi:YidC/Oxa1 family membrane protein insertase